MCTAMCGMPQCKTVSRGCLLLIDALHYAGVLCLCRRRHNHYTVTPQVSTLSVKQLSAPSTSNRSPAPKPLPSSSTQEPDDPVVQDLQKDFGEFTQKAINALSIVYFSALQQTNGLLTTPHRPPGSS